LGIDPSSAGIHSPSKITRAFTPPPRQKGELIEGATPEEIAEKLAKKLRADQVV
jgi:electron transfer flavoprotein alpha/beta subunit